MTTPLLELNASFGLHLRAEGKSKNTIDLYLTAVRFFAAWLEDQGCPADVEHFNRERTRAWLAELAERQKPATVLARWSGLHRFGVWALAEEELDGRHPMAGLARPVIPPEPVPVFSDAELAALIKACSGKAFRDRRDEALIRSMLDCGVRVSELCSWTNGGDGEPDIANGCVLVTGKGGKKRMVYFGTRTARSLDRYRRLRARHRWAEHEKFWLGERGPLTPEGVRKRMLIRAEEAGLSDRSYPHRFRHTFAHDFLLAGGDRGDLKRLAGWSSDVMLERYGASGADHRAMQAAKRLRRGDRV